MRLTGQSLFAVTLLLVVSAPAGAAPQSPGKTSSPISLKNPMIFYLAQGEPNSCGPGCDEWIAAEGEITNGTADRMRAFLKRQTGKAGKRPIYFYSPGGVTSESLAMGRLMRANGVTARVGRTIPLACESNGGDCAATKRSGRPVVSRLTSSRASCASACVYAIVGARLREIAPEAYLGIHASKTIIWGLPRNVTVSAQTRARFKEENRQSIRRYLTEMGIPTALLEAAEKIPHESIHLLSREEIVRFNIDTRNVVESSWIYDERDGGNAMVFKWIDMPETGGARFRKTMLRLSCLAGKFVLGYAREVGPQENSFAPMRLVAASEEFELPPPAGSTVSNDAKQHYDVRSLAVPLRAFETAAAEDRIEIAPGEGKPAVARISTAGLANALSSLTRQCYLESLGGAALVPRQSP